ncbi:hypothetical protein Y032_0446g1605 [Ancylostoma ceylanicum]|uniref:Uncharacterized protein n=1 Tax=Ancylostoma ceylanicum TaxID=53326 RepID=A0A016X0V7_9BILA|nr:hypothetical protein Y032_0446g1605 [Ancylostoma ceylanicum]
MFHAILLCTVLVHILARPLPDDEAIISDLGNPPAEMVGFRYLLDGIPGFAREFYYPALFTLMRIIRIQICMYIDLK